MRINSSYLHIYLILFYFVDSSSCRTSHILCACSFLFPPSLSLHLINNTALATLAFLWFLWSWHALAWSRLPLAPWAWRRVQPRPSFAYNSLCGRCYISSVSSEGYKDSASALQCSPARFTLKKNIFFHFQSPHPSHSPPYSNIITCC